MEHLKKIIVSIELNEEEIELGELVSDDKRIYFKYYSSFIKRGLEISPVKLKSDDTIHHANETPFDGLFGVFADSLPDGWGKLVLDRTLAARGIAIDEVTVLDRLAYVGSNGMGALTYKPEMEPDVLALLHPELDEIAKAAHQIITGTATDGVDELYQLCGSSGGARPKIMVGYYSDSNQLIGTAKRLPDGYQHWLIKFPGSNDLPDIANIEFAYYKMALDAGIEMSESKLFKGRSGRAYFGTKRFDRDGNKRLHLHSAAGLMHDNFRLSTMDYGHIMDCAFRLENDVRAYEKILRLAAFNVFAHNRDDHSKNFSFLMDETGTWKTSPAYDLTFSGSGHGMHSTMIMGESQNPSKKHLMQLADYFKINNAGKIIDQVQTVVLNWETYAELSEVSKESKARISKVIG